MAPKVNTVKMTLVMDIARRVNEDINDMQASHDQWGSEDYSDALSYVADLFSFAGAQMLYNVYANDNDTSVVEHMTMALRQATDDARDALDALRNFGFNYELADLYTDLP